MSRFGTPDIDTGLIHFQDGTLGIREHDGIPGALKNRPVFLFRLPQAIQPFRYHLFKIARKLGQFLLQQFPLSVMSTAVSNT
jgi:hypothetical protein